MTISYNKKLHVDKDFRTSLDIVLDDISEQIRSLQKALANHRHDFNQRLAYLESLFSSKRIGVVWVDHQDNNKCTDCYQAATKLLN